MKYSIEIQDGYMELKYTGTADLHVYSDSFDSVLKHEAWSPGIPMLTDQTELDTSPLTVIQVRTIADLCGARREEAGVGKSALLVARDLEYGMNRMWMAFVENQWDREAKLFRSREEAIAWLKE